jgi:hypothetical protein
MEREPALRIGGERLLWDEVVNGVEVAYRAAFGQHSQSDAGDGFAFAVHEAQTRFDTGKTAVPN